MNNIIKNITRGTVAAVLFASLASASFAATETTKGVRLQPVAAGQTVTLTCASCGSKINAQVTSVSGSPKLAVDSKGRGSQILYVCPSCAIR